MPVTATPRVRCTHCATDNPGNAAACLGCGRPLTAVHDPMVGKILLGGKLHPVQ